MAGSAIGEWGQERFDIAQQTPAIAKITTAYVQKIAKVVGDITKDPQLMAIAAGLGSRLPQDMREEEQPPAEEAPVEEPPVEEPPVEEEPPPRGIIGG